MIKLQISAFYQTKENNNPGLYIEYVCCYVIYLYLQEQILANETGKCAQ